MDGFFANTIGGSKQPDVVGVGTDDQDEQNDVHGDEEQIQILNEEETEEEEDGDDVDDSEPMVMAASINPLSLLNSSLETAPSSLADPTSNESVEDDEEEDDEEEGEENDVLDVSRGDDEEEPLDMSLTRPLIDDIDNEIRNENETIDDVINARRASFSTSSTNEISINIMTSALMTTAVTNTTNDDEEEDEEDDDDDEEDDDYYDDDEDDDDDDDDDEEEEEFAKSVPTVVIDASPMQPPHEKLMQDNGSRQDSGMTDRESIAPEGTNTPFSSISTLHSL